MFQYREFLNSTRLKFGVSVAHTAGSLQYSCHYSSRFRIWWPKGFGGSSSPSRIRRCNDLCQTLMFPKRGRFFICTGFCANAVQMKPLSVDAFSSTKRKRRTKDEHLAKEIDTLSVERENGHERNDWCQTGSRSIEKMVCHNSYC